MLQCDDQLITSEGTSYFCTEEKDHGGLHVCSIDDVQTRPYKVVWGDRIVTEQGFIDTLPVELKLPVY